MDNEIPEFGRKEGIKTALEQLEQYSIKKPVIVETGTTRGKFGGGVEGDGQATLVFGWFCSQCDGHVYTIDIDNECLDECKKITKEYSDYITYVHSNATEYLKTFTDKIDLLYLDSSNDPMDAFKEYMAAKDKLHSKSVVMIDDVNVKGAEVVPILIKDDWKYVYNVNNQNIFVKEPTIKRVIVLMHGLGDNLIATASIDKLKQTYPEDEIHIVGFSYLSAKEIWQNNPSVAQYHELDINFHPTYWDEEQLKDELEIIKQKLFDEVITKIKDKSKIVTQMISISNKDVHELYSIASELGLGHVKNLEMTVTTSDTDKEKANKIIEKFKNNKFYVLHRGAGNYSKSWELTQTKKFVQYMDEKYGLLPFVIDNIKENEFEKFEYEGKTGNPVYLTEQGKVTIPVMKEIMKQSTFFIGTDSFPMHLASSVGVPIVSLFIHTVPRRTRPLTDNSVIVCSSFVYQKTMTMFDHYNFSKRVVLGNDHNKSVRELQHTKVIEALLMILNEGDLNCSQLNS